MRLRRGGEVFLSHAHCETPLTLAGINLGGCRVAELGRQIDTTGRDQREPTSLVRPLITQGKGLRIGNLRVATLSQSMLKDILLIGKNCGRVAQLGERVLCKHEVAGSIPVTSTNFPRKFSG
jgi:hypothetical protein